MTTTAAPAATVQPTERQAAMIRNLRIERIIEPGTLARLDGRLATGFDSAEQVSDTIEWLLARPRKPSPARVEITEGMYLIGADVATGRVFRVREGRNSGRLFGEELVEGSFERVRGALAIIAREGRPMTLDEAKEYGALTGTCCVCGRELTNPDSIAAGIGPVCASKF